MTSYVDLGTRGPITGKLDVTGRNSGNWTVIFTPDILSCNVPQFQVYKMIVKGAPSTTFDVFVENKQWDTAVFGQQNAWDPVQPLTMRPGENLYFFYSDATSDNTPPVVSIWLRYDADLFPPSVWGIKLWDGKLKAEMLFPAVP